MKKSIWMAWVLLLTSVLAHAQLLNPIRWNTQVTQISNGEFELIWEAKLQKHWHLYSQNIEEGGPIPTAFEFAELPQGVTLKGAVAEPEAEEEYDPNYDMMLRYFSNTAKFTQRITISTPNAVKVTGEIYFMVCDSTQCLPPDYTEFSFEIPAGARGKSGDAAKNEGQNGTDPNKVRGDKSNTGSTNTPNVDTRETGDAAKGGSASQTGQTDQTNGSIQEDRTDVDNETQESNPVTSEVGDSAENKPNDRAVTTEEASGNGTPRSTDSEPADKPKSSRSLTGIFLLSFLGGLAALLTPCVFPMIPMTVSFFTKQSKTRAKGISNALVYGLFIILIYTLLGFLITVAFGADALNALSTNVWFNLAFFVLLIIFAISFLGAFEITLPASWINSADRAADRGGLIGIFFMAFTLSLVSFSCTGPIIGTLLVEAAVYGDVAGPLIGMFGFSAALALPFALFAMFPGWMNSLPQSGGWLNSVKVVLGFLELALAFKFLSNADLVVQAGLLTREVFIAIWLAVGFALVLYLFGFIRLPHDSPLDRLSVGRAITGTFVLAFTLYLVPGLWGAPLKLISGFPPPLNYSESPMGFGGNSGSGTSGQDEMLPAHASRGVHGLMLFHDFDHGLEYAEQVNKPILLDFTGHACVNCRKMEEQVWSDPRVLDRLRNDVVLISLYVDEQIDLPAEERYVSEITGKKIRTVGNRWSEFQAKHYQTNSQPYYVLIGHHSLEPLLEPTAYDPDIEKYLEWLETGVTAFKNQ